MSHFLTFSPRRALSLALRCCLMISVLLVIACGGQRPQTAGAGDDDDDYGEEGLTPAERAIPPARTSADEMDGPTAPRGSASRPIEDDD